MGSVRVKPPLPQLNPPRLFKRRLKPIRAAIQPEKIYTVADLAPIFEVSEASVLRWVHQGRFDNSWKDGANQMTGESILAFLKKGRLEYLMKKRQRRARK